MAMDLIFVLARSFKEVTFRTSGQPNERDVNAAARNYAVRGYAQHVHRDVKKLIPRLNNIKSFKADKVQQGLEAMIEKYKDNLMENVDLPLKIQGVQIGDEAEDDASTEADSVLYTDFKKAEEALVELEATQTPVAELDAPGSDQKEGTKQKVSE